MTHSNDAWNVFQKRAFHFFHLKINRVLSKIDEIRYIAKLLHRYIATLLTNGSVIELSKTDR